MILHTCAAEEGLNAADKKVWKMQGWRGAVRGGGYASPEEGGAQRVLLAQKSGHTHRRDGVGAHEDEVDALRVGVVWHFSNGKVGVDAYAHGSGRVGRRHDKRSQAGATMANRASSAVPLEVIGHAEKCRRARASEIIIAGNMRIAVEKCE